MGLKWHLSAASLLFVIRFDLYTRGPRNCKWLNTYNGIDRYSPHMTGWYVYIYVCVCDPHLIFISVINQTWLGNCFNQWADKNWWFFSVGSHHPQARKFAGHLRGGNSQKKQVEMQLLKKYMGVNLKTNHDLAHAKGDANSNSTKLEATKNHK